VIPDRMRAVVQDRYGGPEILRIAELPVPSPGEGEALIEVVAAGINLSDWENLVGSPVYARIGGLRRPRRTIPGSDIAGRVVAVGRGVDGFVPGDEVLVDNLVRRGGFARYAVAPAGTLARKPVDLGFVEAAAIPQPGPIAVQGTAGVGDGTRLLVNGAGGGSGSLAVQLATRAGATVTAVDNAGKLDFLRSIGADRVLDFRATDFARTGETWDVILDLVATRGPLACRRALAPGGRYRAVGGPIGPVLAVGVIGPLVGLVSGRRIGMLAVKAGRDHFGPIAEQVAAGELRVHIDRTVTLDEVPQALADVGAGRALGKVVVEPGR
jgi:NADPH:quinone reductase-like Zn-dependent oxidoreductase